MWPFLLLSLVLFGVHQLVPKNDPLNSTPSTNTTTQLPAVINSNVSQKTVHTDSLPRNQNNLQTNKKPGITSTSTSTSSSRPQFLEFTDPVTNIVYKIPVLGNCVPKDGYRRLRSPITNKLEFENPGPDKTFQIDGAFEHFGFTWKNAPSSRDVLVRFSQTSLANITRDEINEKLSQLGKSQVTAYDWTDQQDSTTKEWSIWPIDSVDSGPYTFNAPIGRKNYLFQLVMKCGDFTLYTPEIHFIEILKGPPEACDAAVSTNIFHDCKICLNPKEACPVVID